MDKSATHDKIFEVLFNKDELTWKEIIFSLVKAENMDIWDIDVSLLTQKYIGILKQLKEMDLRLSGKVVLAAAILLRMKSSRLVGEDIDNFDKFFAEQSEAQGLFDENEPRRPELLDIPSLIPRTPQPRKRKVSIYDLVNALEQALEVKRRRIMQSIPPLPLEVPKNKKDISLIIKDIYLRITHLWGKKSADKLFFTELIPNSGSKEDKVYTFIPLLHLTNERRIDLFQEQHFEDFEIYMLRQSELDKELDDSLPKA